MPSDHPSPRKRTQPDLRIRTRSRTVAMCLSTLVLAFGWCGEPRAAEPRDWPQILGPDRNGVSSETGLLQVWPKSGPREVWRVRGGVGMSGLTIRNGRLITLVQREGQQWLVAHDAKTGAPQWQTPLGPEFENQMGNGPRATPVLTTDRAFAFTGEGILAAVRLEDGKLLWSKDVMSELGGKQAEYGMACSPLVVDNDVIVTLGAPKATVAAFHVDTGKLTWSVGDDPAGYSSPALLRVGGRQQIVVATGASVLGLTPKTGALLWRYPFETNYECNIATPIAVGDRVFISSGENHGSALLAIKPQDEKFAIDEVWVSLGSHSVLRNEWQTSLLIDGFLYGMDNVGGAGPVTHLTCINATTGKRAWQQLRYGKGNLIAADGKLLISTMKGELVVARAKPESYEELGRAEVIGETRQAPALARGLLYMRDDEEIVCLDLRRP